LVDNHVKSICDTDFATPDTLLSLKNFALSETCSSESDCFTQTYRAINENSSTNSSDTSSDAGASTTKKSAYIKLRNGVLLGYVFSGCTNETSDNSAVGTFYVDVNGDDKPNMYGRDYFSFVVTNSGNITSAYEAAGNEYDDDVALERCQKGSSSECYAYLQAHNWKMNY
jgi:hypothetical protein